jgi:hypothetical protein
VVVVVVVVCGLDLDGVRGGTLAAEMPPPLPAPLLLLLLMLPLLLA